MLRFTNKPYVFKEARPNRLIYRCMMWVNRHLMLPGKNHQTDSIELSGQDDFLSLRGDPEVRLIFVSNHSTHSDVEVLMEAQRRCGVWGAFMAAHEVFSRSRIQSWLMQRVGAFSVNRESVDRKSIKEAVRVIKDPVCSLSLFPEGNVAFTNEQVQPFLDGVSLVALKAQRELGDQVMVMVVPTSIRVTHTKDVRGLLSDQLKSLVRELERDGVSVLLDESCPFYQQIESVGYAVLQRGLKRRGYELPINEESWRQNPDDALRSVVEHLLVNLENEMQVECKGGVEERTRFIRSQLVKIRLEAEPDLDQVERWDDQSILLMRVQSYAAHYLRELPTVDRCSETLEKLREDFGEVLVRPDSSRYAHVHFGVPLAVRGKPLQDLTSQLESAVGQGLRLYRSGYAGGESYDTP